MCSDGKGGLARLLKKLVEIPEIHWVRLLYCHPLNLTHEIIDLLAQEEKICRYIDLPLQHISDTVLKKMGRKISRIQLEQRLKTLRDKIPDIALRTTFMVGFPGETKKDFQALYQFTHDMAFDHLGVFRYRDEEGTSAYRFGRKVPEEIKEERYHSLMSLQARISKKKNQSRVGEKIDVLIEGQSSSNHYSLQGRAAFQAPEVDGIIYIKKGGISPGSIVKVRITKGLTYDLVGEMVQS
jgi:ribosomal protein S12 methylthiotransferase